MEDNANNAKLVAYGLNVEVKLVGPSSIPGCVIVRFLDKEFHVSEWAVKTLPKKQG